MAWKGCMSEIGIGNDSEGEYNAHIAAEAMGLMWACFPTLEKHDLEVRNFWSPFRNFL